MREGKTRGKNLFLKKILTWKKKKINSKKLLLVARGEYYFDKKTYNNNIELTAWIAYTCTVV